MRQLHPQVASVLFVHQLASIAVAHALNGERGAVELKLVRTLGRVQAQVTPTFEGRGAADPAKAPTR